MALIYRPTKSVGDWKDLLAEPCHWKQGFSAAAIAHCWEESTGLPPEIKDMFIAYEDGTFRSIELLIALPEHKVSLPGGSACSQNDVWALARTDKDLVSIAIEGKVSEPFGPTVGEWLTDSSQGKQQRLDFIKDLLGLPEIPSTIRYQLLHRFASAVIEAKRFHAAHAIMIVHSFSQTIQWFDDFKAFARLYNTEPVPNVLYPIRPNSKLNLYIGWAKGHERFLKYL